jgi:hypothetical protein
MSCFFLCGGRHMKDDEAMKKRIQGGRKNERLIKIEVQNRL